MRETYTSDEYGYGDYDDFPLQIEADFSQASSRIRWRENEKDPWKATPYSVADFKHNPNDAMDAVAEYLQNQ